jgi:hypothetical protein
VDDQYRRDRDARVPARRRRPGEAHKGQKGECQINTATSEDRPAAAREGIGRSRGGLTGKIYLACDGRGRPLSIVLTAGNVNDCTRFDEVLAGIRVPGSGRDGPAPALTMSSPTRGTARR